MRTAKGKRCVKEVILFAVARSPYLGAAVGECITPADETTEPEEGTESTGERAEKSFPPKGTVDEDCSAGLFWSAEMVEQDSVRPYPMGSCWTDAECGPGKSAKGLRFVHAT